MKPNEREKFAIAIEGKDLVITHAGAGNNKVLVALTALQRERIRIGKRWLCEQLSSGNPAGTLNTTAPLPRKPRKVEVDTCISCGGPMAIERGIVPRAFCPNCG